MHDALSPRGRWHLDARRIPLTDLPLPGAHVARRHAQHGPPSLLVIVDVQSRRLIAARVVFGPDAFAWMELLLSRLGQVRREPGGAFPAEIATDRDVAFSHRAWTAFLRALGIQHVLATPGTQAQDTDPPTDRAIQVILSDLAGAANSGQEFDLDELNYTLAAQLGAGLYDPTPSEEAR